MSHVSVSVDHRIAHPFLQVQRIELSQFSIEIIKRYSAAFKARVSRLQRWTMQDVTHNMAGGRLYLPNNERPVELSEIEASLTQRRTYKVSTSITASTSLR
jgi:hypothetical protein